MKCHNNGVRCSGAWDNGDSILDTLSPIPVRETDDVCCDGHACYYRYPLVYHHVALCL